MDLLDRIEDLEQIVCILSGISPFSQQCSVEIPLELFPTAVFNRTV